MEELLYFLGYENRYSLIVDNNIPKELHPGQSAVINVSGKNVGIIGKLHPSVSKDDVYVMEINITKLLNIRTGAMKYKEISKFPAISKDMAFIVDKKILAGDLITEIKKTGGKLLTDINIFDVYIGDKIEPNEKSIAFNLTFKEPTRTLSEEEVMEIFNKIIDSVTSKFNAKLRDK
jgi:phenylalanyl-tRNA synthetase beta chain